MIVDPRIRTAYNNELNSYKYLLNIIDQTLLSYSKKKNFAYSSRIKTIESISEKIDTGRFKTWDEIDDKIACTIIIPNQRYVDEVINYLSKVFIKENIRIPKETFKDPSVFRFGNVIFVGKLMPINDVSFPIYNIPFEVQIKTAFEHAWSVATHDLTYKSSDIEWSLLRLAATLKSNVEQLDMIILGAKENSKNIPEHQWPEITVKIELLKFYQNLFTKGIIPDELLPKDFNRIIDSIYNLIKSKLDIWKPRKWKKDLKDILDKIEEGMKKLGNPSFPLSITIYQATLGVLLSEKIIDSIEISQKTILLSEIFSSIFPDIKQKEIKQFKINSA